MFLLLNLKIWVFASKYAYVSCVCSAKKRALGALRTGVAEVFSHHGGAENGNCVY